MYYKSCPVCCGINLKFHLRCRDYLVSQKKFDLVKCTDCGFILTQDHPGNVEIGNYYASEEYISHSDSKEGLLNRLYHVARIIMLNKKSRLVKKVCSLKHGSVLDIGSGTGYFLFRMKKSGWETTGLEINESARENSKRSFGLNVLQPDTIKELPDRSFDCVTLWHVLEHLENPSEWLKEIRRVLKPSGVCLIALPNHLSTDARHYKESWAAFDVPRHLWHFSPYTINLFSVKNGFVSAGMKRLPLDALYVSILSEKNLEAGSSLIRGIITGLKSTVVSLVNKKRTSSVIYILKKGIS